MKNVMCVLMLLGFACIVSCAKKQIVKPEPNQLTAQEVQVIEPTPLVVKSIPVKTAIPIKHGPLGDLGHTQVHPKMPIPEIGSVELLDDSIHMLQSFIGYFDYDSAVIREDMLAGLVRVLPKLTGKKLLIEGHCDERGTAAYNMDLGERRADAVAAYLTFNGVSDIVTISYGFDQPVKMGHDEESWKHNRRAVIKIIAD